MVRTIVVNSSNEASIVGIDTPVLNIEKHTDGYMVVKTPGHSAWIGVGRYEYQRIERNVYRVLECLGNKRFSTCRVNAGVAFRVEHAITL